MKRRQQFTAIIEREGEWYVATCPELDIASQGMTVEEARDNLVEAIELFLEVADPSEIQERLHNEVFVTQVGVLVG
ncbi:type II toxin-antitoxin system HicB family antitoxin [Promineifilum sp.]|uniref:type II toxin-antitoxin system HicB family antitoxin n=1 Tax=Promineifilum sp. TaxID=2664178 RepID=UPI0035AEE550